MKTRKLSLTFMLAFAAWCSAWAYSPVLGGEEKLGKGRDQEVPVALSSPVAEMPAEIVTEEAMAKSAEEVQAQQKPAPSAPETTKAVVNNANAPVKNSAAATSRKDLRSALKNLRKENRGSDRTAMPFADDMLIICVILCFFIPPLAVYLWENSIGINFWISLILTLLFWLPGVIFSLIVVLTT